MRVSCKITPPGAIGSVCCMYYGDPVNRCVCVLEIKSKSPKQGLVPNQTNLFISVCGGKQVQGQNECIPNQIYSFKWEPINAGGTGLSSWLLSTREPVARFLCQSHQGCAQKEILLRM